jgi:hypothetical protein
MFPESSTITIHLSRETAAGTIPIAGGEWTTKDEHGVAHRFVWTDRVKDPILRNLDVTVNAAYGHKAQLQRLEAALADVVRHADDGETIALVANVSVSVNGREPREVVLRSAR